MVALAALVVAGLVWGLRPQPPAVDAAVVKRAPLQVTVEEEGKTRVRDRYVVSAPIAGFLQRLDWKVGDRVRSGDVVARIEPPRIQSLDPRTREQNEARVRVTEAALRAAGQRVRIAEEQLRAAQVEAAYRKDELARATTLKKSDDIPQETYDRAAFESRRADTDLSSAQARAAAARVDIETAKAELDAARAALIGPASQSDGAGAGQVAVVRSPVSGRVLRVTHESEGAVNPGEELLAIANARALEVEVEVLSADAVKIAPGGRVVFTRWGGPQPLEGRVRVVEPTGFTKISALGVEEQRVRVIVDITSPEEQWNRLGDGYRVEASFILWESASALQIPTGALFRQSEGWAVFVVEDGVARRRAVETGRRSGLAVEILSGLQEGERVITHPDAAVEDGKPVQAGA